PQRRNRLHFRRRRRRARPGWLDRCPVLFRLVPGGRVRDRPSQPGPIPHPAGRRAHFRGRPPDLSHHRRRRAGPAPHRHHAAVHVLRGLGPHRQLLAPGALGPRQPGGTVVNGPIRRLALALFFCFTVLLGAVTWIQAVRADVYRSDPRNARVAIAQAGKERGVIVAADGEVLAESVPDEEDPRRFNRAYPLGPVFAHMVGYTSPIVGDGGLEAAYVDELRSRRDLTLSDIVAAILGRDLRPRSMRLTLDSRLQQLAYDALGDRAGAVVALDPRTG